MRRIATVFLFSCLVLAGCSAAGSPGSTPVSGGGPTATGAGGGGGGSSGSAALLQAAGAVEHACSLVPADVISQLVPDGSAPQEEQFPRRCGVYGSTTAIGWTIAATDTGDATAPSGAKVVDGVAAGAWIEQLSSGNFSITVLLTSDTGRIYAEVNNSDGKDHSDDVVNLAKTILAKLGG
jgi:hypothetical protein